MEGILENAPRQLHPQSFRKAQMCLQALRSRMSLRVNALMKSLFRPASLSLELLLATKRDFEMALGHCPRQRSAGGWL